MQHSDDMRLINRRAEHYMAEVKDPNKPWIGSGKKLHKSDEEMSQLTDGGKKSQTKKASPKKKTEHTKGEEDLSDKRKTLQDEAKKEGIPKLRDLVHCRAISHRAAQLLNRNVAQLRYIC